MNLDTRTILSAAGAFVVAAVAAFVFGQGLGAGDAPPAVVPSAAAVEPALVAIQIAPEDDAVEVIVARSEQEAASREIASEVDVPLDAATGGVGVGVTETVPEPSLDPPEPPGAPEPPEPTGGSSDDAPALGVVEDECADGGSGCPDGVGGFVLAEIRAIPPLSGKTVWDPAEDGFYSSEPECPAVDVPAGSAYFGARTTRPVTITIRYRAGRWTGDGYEVDGVFTYTTPDAAEAEWDAWIADDEAPDDDPRSRIDNCFFIEGLPARGDYFGFVDYADKYDPSVITTNSPYRVDFDVLLEGGFVPGERRRPTFLLGNGIDELLIGVTARPDHRFVATALEGGAPGACDTGGDEGAFFADGLRRSSEVSDTLIPSERLDDASYPYLPDHTRSLVHRIWLQEGRDYVVCLYWMEPGTTFDRTLVSISEEVLVSTPEAYQPRILLHGFTELFGSLDRGSLHAVGCGFLDFDIAPFTTADTSQMFDEPVELCVGDDELTRLDRGIRLTSSTHLEFDDSWYSSGRWVRTDLECDGRFPDPCRIKLDELFRLPLGSIPTERRLCGTGFGSGCDGEVPTRPAGYAELEIEYLRTPGNGLAEWSIGDVNQFEDTVPEPVGDTPLLDVGFEFELVGHPSQGAVAIVTVTSDREVTLEADLQGIPGCGLDSPNDASGSEFATVHVFELRPLCLGSEYQLSVVAYDRTRGAVGTVVDRFGDHVGTSVDLVVPPVLVYLEMTATASAPTDEPHTIYVRPVTVSVPSIVPPYSARVGWAWPVDDRAVALTNGWRMFGVDGQANACAVGASELLTVNAERRPVLMPQDRITLSVAVDVYENYPVGGIYGECAVAGIAVAHVMQVTVTLPELLAGVEVTSDDGATFFIRATHWRRTLIG